MQRKQWRSMGRTYESAVKLLSGRRSLHRPKNISSNTINAVVTPATRQTPDLRGQPSIAGMSEWLTALGHSPDRINELHVIHIAGTKGKGSTCAFTESFLRAHGSRTGRPQKSGLYTSPHLIFPEERIRINSQPISRDLFTRYFYEVYDSLPGLSGKRHHSTMPTASERGPRILQLYALLALHVFIEEQVDVAILETHNGGEYDATNVVKRPVVTAITSLGMDHVERLGPSIANIAWHKSGIYKEGATALSTTQDAEPAQVLRERAAAKGREVRFVEEDQRLPQKAWPLRVEVQRKNASLALAAAEAWLTSQPPASSGQQLSPEDIELGVRQWSWPGRFQIIEKTRTTWYLDSAHNEMSIRVAAEWFINTTTRTAESGGMVRILVFSHISEERDAPALLRTAAESLKLCGIHVSHVVLTTYDASQSSKGLKRLSDSAILHRVWRAIFKDSRIWDEPTIEGACRLVERLSLENADENAQVLVTGSQHLVGPAVHYLQRTKL